MQPANINDRSSIERIYPRAVFERDANANTRAKASMLCGVHITSTPDASGMFELARAARHAGEQTNGTGTGAIFLCPFAQRTAHGKDYPIAATPPRTAGDDRDPYDAFVDKIIATARHADLTPAPGRGDARLQGLRQ